MATLRNTVKPKSISVTTKATAEQYEKYLAAAGGKPMSEWVRETLDRSIEPKSDVELFMRRSAVTEAVLLRVFADISNGVPITRDRVLQYREACGG